jgi:hypothetical protein
MPVERGNKHEKELGDNVYRYLKNADSIEPVLQRARVEKQY